MGLCADEDLVLLHSSDLHIEAEWAAGRYHGLLGLRAVLTAAEAVRANVVLLAGDTFDHGRIPQRLLDETAEIFRAATVPIVMLPGNHDAIFENGVYEQAGLSALSHVHILGLTHADVVHFEAHDLEVSGKPHVGFGDFAPLGAPRPRRARWHVRMAHGHYLPPEDWESQQHRGWKIGDADIADSGADYLALGHWDRAAAVGDGRVPAYYSGSPDLAGTANVARLGAGGVTVERIPLDWKAFL